MAGYGLTLPQRGVFFGLTTAAEMLDLAARADANPLFGSVWVGDSLGAKPRPDSIALLGALASVTRRLRLGVGCMASFPVRDPLVFAYQWATLDLISNGRMLLAACTGLVAGGASAREGVAFQVTDRERADRLVENIDICGSCGRASTCLTKAAFDPSTTSRCSLARCSNHVRSGLRRTRGRRSPVRASSAR